VGGVRGLVDATEEVRPSGVALVVFALRGRSRRGEIWPRVGGSGLSRGAYVMGYSQQGLGEEDDGGGAAVGDEKEKEKNKIRLGFRFRINI